MKKVISHIPFIIFTFNEGLLSCHTLMIKWVHFTYMLRIFFSKKHQPLIIIIYHVITEIWYTTQFTQKASTIFFNPGNILFDCPITLKCPHFRIPQQNQHLRNKEMKAKDCQKHKVDFLKLCIFIELKIIKCLIKMDRLPEKVESNES